MTVMRGSKYEFGAVIPTREESILRARTLRVEEGEVRFNVGAEQPWPVKLAGSMRQHSGFVIGPRFIGLL